MARSPTSIGALVPRSDSRGTCWSATQRSLPSRGGQADAAGRRRCAPPPGRRRRPARREDLGIELRAPALRAIGCRQRDHLAAWRCRPPPGRSRRPGRPTAAPSASRRHSCRPLLQIERLDRRPCGWPTIDALGRRRRRRARVAVSAPRRIAWWTRRAAARSGWRIGTSAIGASAFFLALEAGAARSAQQRRAQQRSRQRGEAQSVANRVCSRARQFADLQIEQPGIERAGTAAARLAVGLERRRRDRPWPAAHRRALRR